MRTRPRAWMARDPSVCGQELFAARRRVSPSCRAVTLWTPSEVRQGYFKLGSAHSIKSNQHFIVPPREKCNTLGAGHAWGGLLPPGAAIFRKGLSHYSLGFASEATWIQLSSKSPAFVTRKTLGFQGKWANNLLLYLVLPAEKLSYGSRRGYPFSRGRLFGPWGTQGLLEEEAW